jgi:hypothetical protein
MGSASVHIMESKGDIYVAICKRMQTELDCIREQIHLVIELHKKNYVGNPTFYEDDERVGKQLHFLHVRMDLILAMVFMLSSTGADDHLEDDSYLCGMLNSGLNSLFLQRFASSTDIVVK